MHTQREREREREIHTYARHAYPHCTQSSCTLPRARHVLVCTDRGWITATYYPDRIHRIQHFRRCHSPLRKSSSTQSRSHRRRPDRLYLGSHLVPRIQHRNYNRSPGCSRSYRRSGRQLGAANANQPAAFSARARAAVPRAVADSKTAPAGGRSQARSAPATLARGARAGRRVAPCCSAARAEAFFGSALPECLICTHTQTAHYDVPGSVRHGYVQPHHDRVLGCCRVAAWVHDEDHAPLRTHWVIMGNVARACVGVGLPVWMCTSWCVARLCVYPVHASVHIFALQVCVCVCVCVDMRGGGGWVVIRARGLQMTVVGA